MNKLFVVCFIAMACLGALLISQELKQTAIRSKQNTSYFSPIWKQDLDSLEKEVELPPEWGDIKFVRVIALDQNLHSVLKKLKPPILTQKSGSHRLEVSLMSHKSEFNEGKTGIIFQYNLIEIETDEMIWESSRTVFVSTPE